MILTTSPLAPYDGPFGRAEAYHLLRRATFAVPPARVAWAVEGGLEATLEALLRPDAALGPPLNDRYADDPDVPIGATWVSAPRSATQAINSYRANSLNAWMLEHFYAAGPSLERRLWLFWLNHFGVTRGGDIRTAYVYYALLLRGALGSFPDLVKAVAREPQMLAFLDGNENTARSPNENFARELLELFTLGKGPVAGPGDYTTYTEDDVRALARALTGWVVRASDDGDLPRGTFVANRHDREDKRLSHRFDGHVIVDAGEAELDAVVEAIFARPGVGRHLCRKLYRWFVYHEITPAIESAVIEPLAEAFGAAGFRVAVPVRALLASRHFFEARFRGALVKSPLDELLDHMVPLLEPADAPLRERYAVMRRLTQPLNQQGMTLWDPGSVAGYRPFHQAPLYNRGWLSASTLQVRNAAARTYLARGITVEGTSYRPDLLAFVAALDNPGDPNDLVAELAERLLPVPLSPGQLEALKGVLLPGLPDFEWTVEYGDHLADPDDAAMRRAVTNKLTDLFGALFGAAEFHLY